MTFNAIVLLLGLQAAQDPAPGEKLAEELHDKVLKLGPISFKVKLEAVDPKGVKALKYELEIYLDLGEGSFAARWLELRAEELAVKQFMTTEKLEDCRYWTQSDPGGRFNMQPVWRWMHELESERRRFVEPSIPVQTFEEWSRSTQALFILDCNLDPSGSGANFALAFGKKNQGFLSWTESVRRVRPEEGVAELLEVKNPSGEKTTKINRTTGFLDSILVKLKSGEGRLLTVTGFKTGAAKPKYDPPPVRDTWIRSEDIPAIAFELYRSNLGSVLQSILDNWDRLGQDSMKTELKAFLARLVARHDICTRFAAWRGWTGAFLDELRTRGEKLPQPEGDLKALLERVERYIKKGEEMHAGRFEESRENF